jgi:hypothetical protein
LQCGSFSIIEAYGKHLHGAGPFRESITRIIHSRGECDNIGGPVFNQAGNIIGRVVSKLDALKIAESGGDLPQNVNFAIRGEVLSDFLEKNDVEFTASEDTTRLENTDIASQGAAVTVRVRCLRRKPARPVATQP